MMKRGAIWLGGILVSILLAAFPMSAGFAQTPGSGLAESYKSNSDKPIDIVADLLEVDDKKKIAIFKGNVSATQGDFNLRAKELQVTYNSEGGGADKGGGAGPAGSNSDITQIDAKGKVLVTTNNSHTATSDWAVFDVKKQLVTIGGNVVLSQGTNTIKGSRLVIDLTSGLSRFETGAVSNDGKKPRQRLRAIFTPKSRPNTAN